MHEAPDLHKAAQPPLALGTTRSTTRLPVVARGTAAVHDVLADRRTFLRACPSLPGVYAMSDARGRILYVGKSRCLSKRLASYARATPGRDKGFRILAAATWVQWDVLPDEFATALREIELIRLHRPFYNVQFHPLRRRSGYLVLTAEAKPRFLALRRAPHDGEALASIGPLAAKSMLRDATDVLNAEFRLGDGHDVDADVSGARRFLGGRGGAVVRALGVAMREASAALEFERAAALRDRWVPLRWIWRRVREHRQARDCNFVYPVAGPAGRDTWYLLREGQIVGAAPQPLTPRDAGAMRMLIERGYATTSLDATSADADVRAMVVRWFRERPEERTRLLAPAVVLQDWLAVLGGEH